MSFTALKQGESAVQNEHMAEQVIRANDLSKDFTDVGHATLGQLVRNTAKQINVLKELTFSVEKGELLGVIGRNGAGKSTLLRLLAGVYSVTGGNLWVASEPSALFEMGTFLDANATGRIYCEEYFEFLGVPEQEIPTLVEEIREFIEIGPFFDKPVREYSSGMKARLLFAAATARRADVFLIDEALVVGDEYFQAKAWRRLFALLNNGASGVIVTHDMDSVVKLCDKAIYLNKGRVAFEGKSYQTVNTYLGLARRATDEVCLLERERLAETVIHHVSGQDVTIRFSVQVSKVPESRILTIAVSIIRRQRPGGIIHVCKMDNNVSAGHKGVYDYEFRMENVNLETGEYYCTLSLGDPPPSGEGPLVKIYDEQRWIPFTVEGTVLPEKEQPLLNKHVEWCVECI